jgi:hypothetical protein
VTGSGGDSFRIPRDHTLAYILIYQTLGYIVITAFGLPGLFRFRHRGISLWKVTNPGHKTSIV